MSFEHISVMPRQVHDAQALKPGMVCVDCTLGGSGHALSTVRAILPEGLLIGIDQDQDALANAETVLRPHKDNIRLFHSNFSRLPQILAENQIAGVDSILLDLGFSLNQLTRSHRGFSFQKNDPLDMRMDTRTPPHGGGGCKYLLGGAVGKNFFHIRGRAVLPQGGWRNYPPKDPSPPSRPVKNWPNWLMTPFRPNSVQSRKSTRPPGCFRPLGSR